MTPEPTNVNQPTIQQKNLQHQAASELDAKDATRTTESSLNWKGTCLSWIVEVVAVVAKSLKLLVFQSNILL